MTLTRELFIDGSATSAASGRTTEDLDPFTGDVYATVAAASPVDVTRAVDAAAAAFGDWAAMPPVARRPLFLKAADLLDERASEAVEIMTGETGSIAPWAMFNCQLAANMLREAAAAITMPIGEVLPTSMPGAMSLSIRQPAGVVASFAPWNAPVILGIRAIAVPLAVGNTVVLKASEAAPLSAGLWLADILAAAGFPPGVLNVITNDPSEAAAVAEALIGDPRVRRVSFTGSTKTGKIIGQLAAKNMKPAILELGGKNSLIVLDDADLDYAVDAVAFATYMNSGQICMSADRVLVERSIAAEFTERLAAKAAVLPAGDPRDAGTLIGPLINAAAAERVAGLVSAAVANGATVRAGGGKADGAVYPASVLTDVGQDQPIWRDEVFGPVCTVMTVDSADEAVGIANDTPYGLTAGILTEDVRRGLDVALKLRTGIAHVNDQSVDDEPQAPFGGCGDSGYGRFGGRAGVESFTETRWITIQNDHRPFPF